MTQERGCGCGVGVLLLIVGGVALVVLLPFIGLPIIVLGAAAALLGGWIFGRRETDDEDGDESAEDASESGD